MSGKAPQRAADTLHRFRAAAEGHPSIAGHVVPIGSGRDVQEQVWQLTGPLPGWNGYLNRFDGYTHSGDALRAVHRAAAAAGVRFILGKVSGAVAAIERDGSGRATGVRTGDGRRHAASLVIVAAGAAASRLVPAVGAAVDAKSWSVAHVHLTDDETSALRGLPVVYARDLGFFFEPDPKTNLLKLCPMGGGYINTDGQTGVSLPPEPAGASLGFLPAHDEAKLRELLRQTLPALADRPFVKKSLCWFADTADSDFIVDYVPGSVDSVVLLSGDSGHGFKMFPIVGKWITDLLASPSGQTTTRWRWKTPKAKTEGDWGSAVSWRIGETTEFKDIKRSRESKL